MPAADGASPPVPPPPPPPGLLDPEEAERRRRLWWRIGAASAALAVLVAAFAVWVSQDVPYYSLAPGTVYPTTDLVTADAVPLDDPAGEVLFLTVSVNHLNRFERWLAERDDDLDVLDEERVVGDRTDDENRAFNQRLMQDSEQTAIVVALQRLGEDVEITGAGAGVLEVLEDLPVADHLEVGDAIVEADGEPVAVADDLVAAIEAHAPGDHIELVVEDGSATRREERIEVSSREEDPSAPMLGVSIETLDVSVVLPFQVDVDTGSVGGPSAGLAMTLAVLDVLTEGDLTGGLRVATTGTIDIVGAVGEVGGVRQKTLAARRSGVELLLVPAGEVDEARESAGPDMQVVGVATLDEALAALEAAGGDPLPPARDVAG